MTNTGTTEIVFRGQDVLFRLDLSAVKLLKEDTTDVLLPRQQMNLLRYFIDNPKRLISRDELLGKFWDHQKDPKVSDGALSTAVRALRKALGEKKGKKAEFIETVIGQGFRFVALIDTSDERTGRDSPLENGQQHAGLITPTAQPVEEQRASPAVSANAQGESGTFVTEREGMKAQTLSDVFGWIAVSAFGLAAYGPVLVNGTESREIEVTALKLVEDPLAELGIVAELPNPQDLGRSLSVLRAVQRRLEQEIESRFGPRHRAFFSFVFGMTTIARAHGEPPPRELVEQAHENLKHLASRVGLNIAEVDSHLSAIESARNTEEKAKARDAFESWVLSGARRLSAAPNKP